MPALELDSLFNSSFDQLVPSFLEPAGDDSWEQSAECDFFRYRCTNMEDAVEAVTHGQLCVPGPHMSVKQGNVHDCERHNRVCLYWSPPGSTCFPRIEKLTE